jgi:DNA invertase Pin-like site-specific DNA recombinase
MTRVALYAHYSSDQQSASSIDDQLRICREQATRDGWQVVGVYKDVAISGSSVTLRPGMQALLQDAQGRKFDAVLAEALDRVSRDQADVATLYKHLHFAGVSRSSPSPRARSRSCMLAPGHDERAVPEGSREEDPSRPARARREGQGGRRPLLRL